MLAALTRYCNQLSELHPEVVPDEAWSREYVKYIFELSKEGALLNIIPLEGKKGLVKAVPRRQGRTSGVTPYLLCDNSSYMLGVDAKGNPVRSKECFERARDLHERILGGLESPCAKAVLAYFQCWTPDKASTNEAVLRTGAELLEGGNIVFALRDNAMLLEVLDDSEVHAACEKFAQQDDGTGDKMICLVTGERRDVARTHPQFRGVRGAQSSGAALVSFNCEAFESYGRRGGQGKNAPVSVEAARAYGIALDYLLKDPGHCFHLGETTVVFWSEHSDEANSGLMGDLLCLTKYDERLQDDDQDARLERAVTALMRGMSIDGKSLDLSSPFYVLGLSPNKSRLAVRFFNCDEFGSVASNVRRFYEETSMVHVPFERDVVSPYAVLRSVENKNSKREIVLSQLSASFMRAVLEGLSYPEAMYGNILIRIRATHEVNRVHAAFIRAYLIRNIGRSKEEVTVGLNRQRNDAAYVLGRMFSILEQIQESANGGKSTIAGRYLNSACATPASVFPLLLRLATAHLNKMEKEKPGFAYVLRKELTSTMGMLEAYPKTLGLADQGDFFLGYYHQQQDRYSSKNNAAVKTDESIVDLEVAE